MTPPLMDSLQAILAGIDTSLGRQWRIEDREWRKEDCQWRNEEREWKVQEKRLRDISYRLRHVEKNRRNVEEKSEQLRSISNQAALIAGFAVVALTEFQIEEGRRDGWVIPIFGATTALVVGLMVVAMITCTLMLAGILKRGKTFVDLVEEEAFMIKCQEYVMDYQGNSNNRYPPAPEHTFEDHWKNRCEEDWKLAFRLFSWGLPLFIVDMILIAWLKFHFTFPTSVVVTVIAVIAILSWYYMHRKWGSYLVEDEDEDVFTLARFKDGFDITEPKFFSDPDPESDPYLEIDPDPAQSVVADSPISATTEPSTRGFSVTSDTLPNAAYISQEHSHLQDYPIWCWHRMVKRPTDLPPPTYEEFPSDRPSHSPPSPRSQPAPSPRTRVSSGVGAGEERRWRGEFYDQDDVEMQLGQSSFLGGARSSNSASILERERERE